IAVVRAVQLEHGRPALVDQLKTRVSRRTLAIPADVADLLRPLVAERPDGLLFTADNGGPVWPSMARGVLAAKCAAVNDAAVDAWKDAGGHGDKPELMPTVTPNELRHTFATLAADRLPPHQIADILGHTTSRMVDQTYRHRPPVI